MRATLISDGDEQIVLLPEGLFTDGEEVTIRRDGDAVILERAPADAAPEGSQLNTAHLGEGRDPGLF